MNPVDTVEALDATLSRLPAAVVVLDPIVPSLDDVRALLPVIDRHRSVHIVVYTVADAAAMRAYGVLAAYGVRHLAICGVDDGADDFRRLLELVPADTLAVELLDMIDPLLKRLPPALARAVGTLFRSPPAAPDFDAVARAAGMSRRACDRALERAGVASGDVLVRTARVVRAYHFLRSTRLPVRSVAEMTGYGTQKSFSRDVYHLTGALPSALRHTLDPETFLERAAARIWRHGRPAALLDDDGSLHVQRLVR